MVCTSCSCGQNGPQVRLDTLVNFHRAEPRFAGQFSSRRNTHVHSLRANALIAEPGLRIATCPLVENGVLRVLNLPAYGRIGPFGLDRVRRQIQRACAELDHVFWPDDLTLRDNGPVDWSRVRGHQQVTDVYLLALAVKHDGCLVSFDQSVALSAVRGATGAHFRML